MDCEFSASVFDDEFLLLSKVDASEVNTFKFAISRCNANVHLVCTSNSVISLAYVILYIIKLEEPHLHWIFCMSLHNKGFVGSKTFKCMLESTIGWHISYVATISHEVGGSRICKIKKSTSKREKARLVVLCEVETCYNMCTDLPSDIRM